MAVLVLLGFFQIQQEMVFPKHVSPLFAVTNAVINIAPVLPIVAFTLAEFGRNETAAPARNWILVVLTFACAAAGLAITLLVSVFTYSGGAILFAKGTGLTVSTCLVIQHLSGDQQKRPRKALSNLILLFPSVLACWSLAVGFRVASQATSIAGDRAYCISSHGDDKSGPVSSLAALRGFSFYTSGGGYRRGDHWYFHGVLLIDNDGDIVIYNWSPRRFQFDLVTEPDKLLVNPKRDCDPKLGFLRSLQII